MKIVAKSAIAKAAERGLAFRWRSLKRQMGDKWRSIKSSVKRRLPAFQGSAVDYVC